LVTEVEVRIEVTSVCGQPGFGGTLTVDTG